MDTEFLDWALADFSGYVAADELYDGPFCILSAVDNRRYKRILYDVLDHDPTHDDIRAFLRRLSPQTGSNAACHSARPAYPMLCCPTPQQPGITWSRRRPCGHEDAGSGARRDASAHSAHAPGPVPAAAPPGAGARCARWPDSHTTVSNTVVSRRGKRSDHTLGNSADTRWNAG